MGSNGSGSAGEDGATSSEPLPPETLMIACYFIMGAQYALMSLVAPFFPQKAQVRSHTRRARRHPGHLPPRVLPRPPHPP
jgi:hypothetical protein